MVENKIYRCKPILRIFATILAISLAYIALFDYETKLDYFGIISVIGSIYLSIVGLTFKIKISEHNLEIECLVMPFRNDIVLWEDVKKVKYGLIFKEVEYFSRRKNKIVSQVIGIMVGNLVEAIMEKIGQDTIE